MSSWLQMPDSWRCSYTMHVRAVLCNRCHKLTNFTSSRRNCLPDLRGKFLLPAYHSGSDTLPFWLYIATNWLDKLHTGSYDFYLRSWLVRLS
jgi:hypothetical protein